MVLCCRHRVWYRIAIQQQNSRFEKPRSLFPNRLFRFRLGVRVSCSIDGSNPQKVNAKGNASSVRKYLRFSGGLFEVSQAVWQMSQCTWHLCGKISENRRGLCSVTNTDFTPPSEDPFPVIGEFLGVVDGRPATRLPRMSRTYSIGSENLILTSATVRAPFRINMEIDDGATMNGDASVDRHAHCRI
ncbi:hypothetical protein TNCV_4081331 [Trichonephila clavipes]|nr:hypothetical protein TNCV_4081331 [Trichonephila clavipes]